MKRILELQKLKASPQKAGCPFKQSTNPGSRAC